MKEGGFDVANFSSLFGSFMDAAEMMDADAVVQAVITDKRGHAFSKSFDFGSTHQAQGESKSAAQTMATRKCLILDTDFLQHPPAEAQLQLQHSPDQHSSKTIHHHWEPQAVASQQGCISSQQQQQRRTSSDYGCQEATQPPDPGTRSNSQEEAELRGNGFLGLLLDSAPPRLALTSAGAAPALELPGKLGLRTASTAPQPFLSSHLTASSAAFSSPGHGRYSSQGHLSWSPRSAAQAGNAQGQTSPAGKAIYSGLACNLQGSSPAGKAPNSTAVWPLDRVRSSPRHMGPLSDTPFAHFALPVSEWDAVGAARTAPCTPTKQSSGSSSQQQLCLSSQPQPTIPYGLPGDLGSGYHHPIGSTGPHFPATRGVLPRRASMASAYVPDAPPSQQQHALNGLGLPPGASLSASHGSLHSHAYSSAHHYPAHGTHSHPHNAASSAAHWVPHASKLGGARRQLGLTGESVRVPSVARLSGDGSAMAAADSSGRWHQVSGPPEADGRASTPGQPSIAVMDDQPGCYQQASAPRRLPASAPSSFASAMPPFLSPLPPGISHPPDGQRGMLSDGLPLAGCPGHMPTQIQRTLTLPNVKTGPQPRSRRTSRDRLDPLADARAAHLLPSYSVELPTSCSAPATTAGAGASTALGPAGLPIPATTTAAAAAVPGRKEQSRLACSDLPQLNQGIEELLDSPRSERQDRPQTVELELDPDRPDEGWMAANLCHTRFSNDPVLVSLPSVMAEHIRADLGRIREKLLRRKKLEQQQLMLAEAGAGAGARQEAQQTAAPGAVEEDGNSPKVLELSLALSAPTPRPRPLDACDGMSPAKRPARGLASAACGAHAYPPLTHQDKRQAAACAGSPRHPAAAAASPPAPSGGRQSLPAGSRCEEEQAHADSPVASATALDWEGDMDFRHELWADHDMDDGLDVMML